MSASQNPPLGTVAVVYLAWGPLGTEYVRRFIESYASHPAGFPHELVIALNNVEPADQAEIATICGDIPHSVFVLDSPVFDLEAYRLAIKRYDADAYCFLNTYSRVLAPSWLARYATALATDDVGLVGAGGSYRSMREFNPWLIDSAGLSVVKQAWLQQQAIRRAARFRWHFGAAPTPFVRANAYALTAATLQQIDWPLTRSKFETLVEEAGRRSLTVRVREAGLRCVVVDTDGGVLDIPDWPTSGTFWSDDQDKLLIADNRSDEYERASASERRALASINWLGYGSARELRPRRLSALTSARRRLGGTDVG